MLWGIFTICTDSLESSRIISTYERTTHGIPINPLYTGNPKTGTLASSADLDEMQHSAAFHQGLHCLVRLKQP